jgi:hypothetical protein
MASRPVTMYMRWRLTALDSLLTYPISPVRAVNTRKRALVAAAGASLRSIALKTLNRRSGGFL